MNFTACVVPTTPFVRKLAKCIDLVKMQMKIKNCSCIVCRNSLSCTMYNSVYIVKSSYQIALRPSFADLPLPYIPRVKILGPQLPCCYWASLLRATPPPHSLPWERFSVDISLDFGVTVTTLPARPPWVGLPRPSSAALAFNG